MLDFVLPDGRSGDICLALFPLLPLSPFVLRVAVPPTLCGLFCRKEREELSEERERVFFLVSRRGTLVSSCTTTSACGAGSA